MTFKVSFNSGTGNDDLDEENKAGKHGKPHILEFDTYAERAAFLQGVYLTSEVTNGWVDAWVEAKIIDEPREEKSPYSPEDLLVATGFLHSLKGKTVEEMQTMIDDYVKDVGITTPRSYSKFSVLTAMARELRAAPGMSTVLDALKTHLMENM